ncbi:MAG: D-TA family PLP-dependent enzyme [Ginsengibacter sp.]
MTMNADTKKEWYRVKDIDAVDSPALVVYRDRVLENINTLISMIDDVNRLRPHVKTHKSIDATLLLMASGINKFKCATIAEAEMLGIAGAADVLLAYQPIGPKLQRFIALIKKYTATNYSCLVDNIEAVKEIADKTVENNLAVPVYIDLNVGMNRTGIQPGNQAIELYKKAQKLKGVVPMGLHAYDGHIRAIDFTERTLACDSAFEGVVAMQQLLIKDGFAEPIIIAGGSPTFPMHAKRKNIECSPGTFIYWDDGYRRLCEEQHFLTAALVVTRIISLPGETRLCLDLGHKSIAAENTLDNRVYFLNAPELQFVSQSEEHLVVEAPPGHSYKVGDVFYGIPVHICPTVALYERAIVIENSEVTTEWKTIARDRKIHI